jgi:signal transduction histidine kinase
MKRLEFTQKLVLITALASALVWIVFGVVFYLVTEHSLREQLTDYQVGKAEDLMESVDRRLFSAQQGIQVLARQGRLMGFLADQLTAAERSRKEVIAENLESLSLLTGPWEVVSVLDTGGDILVSNMPGESVRSVATHPEYREAFEAAMNGRLYSSDLRLAGESKSPSLIFAAPIRREGLQEAEVIGAVIGKYAWPAISQLLDSLGNDAEVRLLRSDGMIIAAASRNRDWIGRAAPKWAKLQSENSGARTLVRTDHSEANDEPELLVATPQQGYLGYRGQGWLLVLETPFDVLLAPVRRLEWQLGGAALASVVVLCVVLFLAGLYLTRPLGAMSRTVNAFSRGDMSARVDVAPGSNDEIARLGRAFNAMARDIGFYIEQVRENSKEVQAFAYIVSHDLRAPLVNLKGFSAEIGYSLQELDEALGPALELVPEASKANARMILDQDIPEALGFISSSVKRMDRQIQAVLKLSRLGRKEFTWEQVDSAAVVRQLLSSLRHQLEEKQVTVETGSLPVVEADAIALEQIFGNLLDNAAKYIDDLPGKIEIWSEQTEEEVIFHIRDNGSGIDSVNIPKVFELFRRVGRTDIAGEGMGLAYVKTLVRRHGGRIWCESAPGEGSTFGFSLAKRPSEQKREIG